MNRMVLVDDTPLAFLRQPDNGIPIFNFRCVSGHHTSRSSFGQKVLARFVPPSVRTWSLAHDIVGRGGQVS